MWMEACPPYWEKEETGKVKDGGMESVSGPNPTHCNIFDVYRFSERARLERAHYLDA